MRDFHSFGDYNSSTFKTLVINSELSEFLRADLVLSLALLQRALYVSYERVHKATSVSHLLPGPSIHRAQVSTRGGGQNKGYCIYTIHTVNALTLHRSGCVFQVRHC